MDNSLFSKILSDVAVLMQARGDNVFKVRAHSRASDVINNLSYSIADIAHDAKQLKNIPGFGAGIIEITQEIAITGNLRLLDELIAELPDGVLALVEIPGIGPKTAVAAAGELGVTNYTDLAVSIKSGQFQKLPRISNKAALQILRHVDMRIAQGDRIGLGQATQAGLSVIAGLRKRCGNIERIEIVGNIRRAIELVDEVQLLCGSETPENAKEIVEVFTTLDKAHIVNFFDGSRGEFIDRNGLRCSIDVVPVGAFAAVAVYMTASDDHRVALQDMAKGTGLRFTSQGLYEDHSNALIRIDSETGVYERLGLSYVPSEMRQGDGELEIAKSEGFSGIITSTDIKGDLHTHTNWSDGRFSMEEMVTAAKECGLEYIAVTDHSPSATVANGLDIDMLRAHNLAVKQLAISSGLNLLAGTEMDIKPDGSLDYPNDVLDELDIVIASIHSGMDQDSATITQRVIGAMESPYVDVICHLTARLVGRRAPVEMDVNAVLEAAVQPGTVLEINASPDRLDLRSEHVRLANELGVIFAINTDSHRIWQFGNMRYGVSTAIRGWVESKRVINTLSYGELISFLKLPKLERYAFNESRSR